MAPRSVPNRRNVKSGSDAATDARERPKDYLNETEIADLLQAAKRGRHGIRDHLLVLMMFRHGLRVSEATGLRRDDVGENSRKGNFRTLQRVTVVLHSEAIREVVLALEFPG